MTVASNLPDGDAANDGGSSQNEEQETREVVNYEVSEIQREISRGPGAIKRLSVAVLVDGIRTVADDGSVSWTPRPEEELEALRALVASAVGFDEARGDSLTLRSMEFEPVFAQGSEPASGFLPSASLDPMRLIQVAVLALVTLLLGLFVVRPILSGARPVAALPTPDQGALGDTSSDSASEALTGEIDESDAPPTDLQLITEDGAARPATRNEDVDDTDAVERLRKLIEQRRGESVAILKSWMEDEEAV